ncbi:hypothetical protein HAX54_035322 [Datura stramonium]|uniref:Uncharacterized protein n=1 Tax=Datura stramonium TaxID=4076 RepID=A0ABS8VG86_DATST|nr:hypothetical protein [Datura stramonium]
MRSRGCLAGQSTRTTPPLTEGPMGNPIVYVPALSTTNVDIRGAIQMLTQLVAAQTQRQEIVSTMKARMDHYVYSLGTHLAGDCTSSLLNKEMDICRLMAYAQQMEDLKKKIRVDKDSNQHKMARLAGYNDHTPTGTSLMGDHHIGNHLPQVHHLPDIGMIGEVKMDKARTLEHSDS